MLITTKRLFNMGGCKKNKIIFISSLIILLILSLLFIIEKYNISEPNQYTEKNRNIEINGEITPFSHGQGVQYYSLEEIKESYDDIFSISINNTILNDTDFLYKCRNIQTIKFSNCILYNLDFLKNFHDLKYISFIDCQFKEFSDITLISNPEKLQYLTLCRCYINKEALENIDFLKIFTSLIYLDLTDNNIKTIDAVSEMESLETLILCDNYSLQFIDGLYNLKKLETVIIPPTYNYSSEDKANLGELNSSNGFMQVD